MHHPALPSLAAGVSCTLPVFQAAPSHEHLLVADTQSSVGVVLKNQGKYPEALEMYNKALKTVLSPEHPQVARVKVGFCLGFHVPV